MRYCVNKRLLAPVFIKDTISGKTEWRNRKLAKMIRWDGAKLLFFAAPARFFYVAANSQAAATSLSHFFMKDVFAAPDNFFATADAVHVNPAAAAGASRTCANTVKLVNAAMRIAVDLIN